MGPDSLPRRLRQALFPHGTRREAVAKAIYHSLRGRRPENETLPSESQTAAGAKIPAPGLNPGPGDNLGDCPLLPRPTPEFLAELDLNDAERRTGRKADIICFSIIDWSFRYQRPQQMMSQAAAAGHRVFYLSPSVFLGPQASPRCQAVPIKRNVWEVKLAARRTPDIYGEVIDGVHADSFLDSLEDLQRQFDIGEAIAYTMIPSWTPVALKARTRWGWPIIYDCMDEWEGFPGIHAALLQGERKLVRGCDLVVVTAQRLYDKWKDAGPPVVLARNAADAAYYHQRCKPNKLLPAPHPVVGYFGAIADWFDVDLVAHAARMRPDVTFVLLGGVFDTDVSTLEALPNVRLLGQQPYETMPQYLYHFDACIIPFKINAITAATDPVKLYEYFTAGKPVVATPMPELAPYRDLLYIANGRDEFVAQIAAALAEKDKSAVSRRKATALEHSWESRWRAVEACLQMAVPKASIVIVTHNQLPLTRLCLESILRNTQHPNYEVIVVDNASSDGSAAFLTEFARRHPHISAILNETNLGFAAANNQGLERTSGERLVLLNNDTIVPPGWLNRLLRHLDDPCVGLVGPTTNFVGNEARVEPPYETMLQMEQYAHERARQFADQAADIHMLAMFCVAFRRATYDAVGPLDERFGIGMFEDDDYSMRIKSVGLEVVCALDSFVHHFGQASFGQLIDNGTYNPLFERNRSLYELKWNVTWKPHVHAPLAPRTHLPPTK